MVTATNGTAAFVGKSGRVYNVDLYISDVVAAALTFSTTGAAGTGSLQYFIPPEDVVLRDLSIVTGPTVMVGFYMTENGAPRAGTSVRIANFLNTLANRQVINIPFRGGSQIGAVQF